MPSKNWRSEPAGEGPAPASDSRARLKLAAALFGVAAVWLVALPTAGRLSVVRRHIERLEAARIDPSAMYYTELEMIGDVRDQMNEFRARHPDALWSGRGDETAPAKSLAAPALSTANSRR